MVYDDRWRLAVECGKKVYPYVQMCEYSISLAIAN